MAKKIVICNRKGGVGKTSTVANVAAILAESGHSVLAVDLDSQCNLTMSFGVDSESLERSANDVLLGRCSLHDAALSKGDNLALVAARPDLEKVVSSREVSSHGRKFELLKFAIAEADRLYDYIIIDTPTHVESVNGINGLSVADFAVVPLILDRYSLGGVRQVMDIVRGLRDQWINRELRILGLLPTFYQANTKVCRKYLTIFLESKYKDLLFTTKIRRSAAIPTAASRGIPVTLYDRHSHGYEDYAKVTAEMLARMGEGNA